VTQTAPPTPRRVLIIEDQIGDLLWLLDLIRSRGYETVLVTNEDAARRRLEAVSRGEESYALAIVDVAVAIKDLADLIALDDQFFEDSQDTGIRLCRYARHELGLTPERFTLACLTVRDDLDVRREMKALQVPLFNKAAQSPAESIRGFIEQQLKPPA
jgi:CheY-like chemotaxis protein